MVVLPILWTVLLAFQRLRLLNLRTSGLFGNFTLNNFDNVFGSAAFWGSLGTTLAYSVLGTAAAIGVGLVAALALRRRSAAATWSARRCCCPTSRRSWPSRSSGRPC